MFHYRSHGWTQKWWVLTLEQVETNTEAINDLVEVAGGQVRVWLDWGRVSKLIKDKQLRDDGLSSILELSVNLGMESAI